MTFNTNLFTILSTGLQSFKLANEKRNGTLQSFTLQSFSQVAKCQLIKRL